MIMKTDFYINGAWITPTEKNDYSVIDPSTEKPCATISLGTSVDVDKAVRAARTAFETYSLTSREERLALLSKLLEIMERRNEEMGAAISMEMGAPIDFANDVQAGTGPHHLRGFIDALKNHTFEEKFKGTEEIILQEAIGVCGLITPWNWPVNQIALKVIPALATGCTCVLKPSEIAPLSAMVFAEMIDEAGFPAGVFNLVNGDGINVGDAMSRHPDIDMMSFTGSTRAGTAVSKSAADTVKRVALELGGKSPNIIFADSNIEESVTAGVQACMDNSGQSCDAPTRMLVERSVYDRAVEIAETAAKNVVVDVASKSGGHIGPVVSEMHFNKIQGLIQVAIDEGARLIAGGTGKPAGLETGYFVKPTVFADVSNDMRIAQEEIFGPVLVMIPFEDEQDAIKIANDIPFGLSSYIQTGSMERAERVARRIRAGMVHINGAYLQEGSPFGGYKQSGLGREGGKWGMEDYLETKAITR